MHSKQSHTILRSREGRTPGRSAQSTPFQYHPDAYNKDNATRSAHHNLCRRYLYLEYLKFAFCYQTTLSKGFTEPLRVFGSPGYALFSRKEHSHGIHEKENDQVSAPPQWLATDLCTVSAISWNSHRQKPSSGEETSSENSCSITTFQIHGGNTMGMQVPINGPA